jgi:tRNA (guanosine-2'-O-)-methyltransferase
MPANIEDFLASFLTPDRLARMDEVLARRTRHVAVVLENVHRTQNASACLRNCEAFGVQDVHVIPNSAGFRVNRDIAQGAAQWLTLHQHVSPDHDQTRDCFETLRERGYRIVAVSGRGATGPLSDYEPRHPTALVFGNEHEGLSESAISAADEIRSLPLSGFTESFNLSVAVALALQEMLPRVRQPEIAWQLTTEEKQELRQAWVRRTLGYRVQQIERDFHRRMQTSPSHPPA